MQFRDLSVGTSFDWIAYNDTRMFNSFFKRCRKISARRYEDEDRRAYTVGSINAQVYNVAE